MRTRTLLLLATVLTLAALVAAAVAAEGVTAGGAAMPRRTPPPADIPSSGSLWAAAVLHAWDQQRAAAWADGDVGALAGLYTSGSRTGARDVADLRHWRRRGLRVVGLRQQVVALRLHVPAPRHLVLTVTDRTVDGVAVGSRRTALPTSAWVSHRIRLRRVHGRWLVEEVSAQPARCPQRVASLDQGPMSITRPSTSTTTRSA